MSQLKVLLALMALIALVKTNEEDRYIVIKPSKDPGE